MPPKPESAETTSTPTQHLANRYLFFCANPPKYVTKIPLGPELKLLQLPRKCSILRKPAGPAECSHSESIAIEIKFLMRIGYRQAPSSRARSDSSSSRATCQPGGLSLQYGF